MNHSSVIINDQSGCSRINDHLSSCSLHCQVMGLRGGIGCLLALFVGLVWLECTVSTDYFHFRPVKISRCIINSRQWIVLVHGRFCYDGSMCFAPLISEREFNCLGVDSRTKKTVINWIFLKILRGVYRQIYPLYRLYYRSISTSLISELRVIKSTFLASDVWHSILSFFVLWNLFLLVVFCGRIRLAWNRTILVSVT